MYPFVRLANEPLLTNKDYGKQKLNELGAVGQFREDLQAELKDPQKAQQVIDYLLGQNFPESMHEDILDAIGWESEQQWTISKLRKRGPAFRESILEAYGRKCAICGFQIRPGDQLVGLEAAHIKWHQAGGPDVEQNGVVMCSMHHKLFDYDLFAINLDLLVKVSTRANGGFGLKEWLHDFHGKPISKPSKDLHYPERVFILWQVSEVFKGDYREFPINP